MDARSGSDGRCDLALRAMADATVSLDAAAVVIARKLLVIS